MRYQKNNFNKKLTDMPRVAMYIWRFEPIIGGTEQQCKRLSEELIKKGINVFIVTEKTRDAKGFEIINSVQVYRVGSLDWLRNLPGYLKKFFRLDRKDKEYHGFSDNNSNKPGVLKLASSFLTYWLPNHYFFITSLWLLYKKRKDFDILHVHEAHWIALFGARIAGMLNKKIIIKEVISGRLITFDTLSRRSKKKVMKAEVFIAISKQISKDLILLGIGQEKIKVIPNGVSVDGEKWGHNDFREKSAICISKLNELPNKGIDVILKAWRILTREFNKDTKLRIFGRGDRSLHKDLAMELGIEKFVSFPGFAENVNPYLLNSYMFILPSREEGLSNALLEAMALGLPCIATDIPGNQDLITDNINGRLVPSGDSCALAKAIAFMLDNLDRAIEMGSNARKTIENGYTISNISEKYIELYKEVISK